MLTHPIIEKLQALCFSGMLKGFEEQLQSSEIDTLSFEDRFGLLVDREMTVRQNKRLKARLGKAKLRHQACVEDIDFRHPRKLDKGVVLDLATCRWIKNHSNLLIIGPTGIGKSYLACAFAQKACLEGYSALYLRLPKLLYEINVSKGDGRYARLLSGFSKTDVLILDDWGLSTFTKEQRHDLLEIIEDRHGLRSTIVTSQLPVEHWHEVIGDPTLADAILDRLVHNAYKLHMEGDSMRKTKTKLT